MARNDRIIIKGTSHGLNITFGSGIWNSLLEELDERLDKQASFFKGGRVALRVGPRQLTRPQLESAGQILDKHGVTLWAIESDSAGTQEAAQQLNLETTVTSSRPAPSPSQPEPPAGDSILVKRTLRSGQVFHHPGNIIVLGDVNPGAELRAGGDIIVWGRIRGTVHAGIRTGTEAIVCALQLAPMQLHIGEVMSRSPAVEDLSDMIPEIASVQDGQIVAEPWSG